MEPIQIIQLPVWWMKGKINNFFFLLLVRSMLKMLSYRKYFCTQLMHCQNSASDVTLNWKRIEIISPNNSHRLSRFETYSRQNHTHTHAIHRLSFDKQIKWDFIGSLDVNVPIVSSICRFVCLFLDFKTKWKLSIPSGRTNAP